MAYQDVRAIDWPNAINSEEDPPIYLGPSVDPAYRDTHQSDHWGRNRVFIIDRKQSPARSIAGPSTRLYRCFHYCNEVQSRCYGGALDVELVFQSSNNMGVATRHHAARDILPFEIPMSPVHHPSIGQETHIGDLETSSEGLGSGCGRMMRNNDPVPAIPDMPDTYDCPLRTVPNEFMLAVKVLCSVSGIPRRQGRGPKTTNVHYPANESSALRTHNSYLQLVHQQDSYIATEQAWKPGNKVHPPKKYRLCRTTKDHQYLHSCDRDDLIVNIHIVCIMLMLIVWGKGSVGGTTLAGRSSSLHRHDSHLVSAGSHTNFRHDHDARPVRFCLLFALFVLGMDRSRINQRFCGFEYPLPVLKLLAPGANRWFGGTITEILLPTPLPPLPPHFDSSPPDSWNCTVLAYDTHSAQMYLAELARNFARAVIAPGSEQLNDFQQNRSDMHAPWFPRCVMNHACPWISKEYRL
ncbi:predicted protein [Plenodomus lingam JN3]|uniref:Predicted protein n=1 Tax=Leptosphaeria maculans (strain JN3 / isolate v23.1.3 / race Av1-4-5-6-7-8) TaxID=985895 RepID=E4ZTB6_LEPMJ|nr:predicted protein [Plenodomus lingam JN3]CBX94772.1 predicted protein [Plenodomus lingam JN3]